MQPSALEPALLQAMFGSALHDAMPYWQIGQNLLDYFIATLLPEPPAGPWYGSTLPNGGYFVRPVANEVLQVQSTNGLMATVSAEAAGMVVTLFAMATVLEQVYRPDATPTADQYRLDERYYLLRDHALAHPESQVIMDLID